MARQDQLSAPATKADIAAIMESIGRLYDANERWKDEILRHFDVVAENLHKDFLGAFDDRTQQHHGDLGDLKRRVRAIESHLGLAA